MMGFPVRRMEEFSGQEAVENPAADPAQGHRLTSDGRRDFLPVSNTSNAKGTGVVAGCWPSLNSFPFLTTNPLKMRCLWERNRKGKDM